MRGDGRRLLRHVDHDGAGDGIEALGEQRHCGGRIARDEWPELGRRAAGAGEQVAVTARRERGDGRGPTGEVGEHGAAVGAERGAIEVVHAVGDARFRRGGITGAAPAAPAQQVPTGRNPMRPYTSAPAGVASSTGSSPAPVSAAVAHSTSRVARPSRRYGVWTSTMLTQPNTGG